MMDSLQTIIAHATKLTMTILIALSGCDRSQEAAPKSSGAASELSPPQHTAAWRGNTIAVDDERVRTLLRDAMNRARETAAEARNRFDESTAVERRRWLIKWAHGATSSDGLSDDETEYLWVRPISWSEFRIEGVLLNAPLQDEFAPGDIVAFPAEELADWVYLVEGTFDGAMQGGYTVVVLEQEYGAPSADDDR